MTITFEQKRLVQDSWRLVAPIADVAADIFYARLFETNPELRPMFAHSNMKEQKLKLMQMLGMAVKGLDNLEQLVPAVENLGRRHVGYGVEDRHYDAVGAALLWTLEKGLGEAFTPATREAWTQTYTLVASVMREAANEAVPA
jgi:hemoglobin-like flavoprotein